MICECSFLQEKMAVDWWGFAYAAALALGGFMGYKRKGMNCDVVVFMHLSNGTYAAKY